VGITLGRLSLPVNQRLQAFPLHSWRAEFNQAREAGLAFLEWLFNRESAAHNPLASEAGIREMRHLTDLSGVPVISVCADSLLEQSLFDPGWAGQASIEQIKWLVGQAHKAQLAYVVLPFFKASALKAEDDLSQTAAVLRSCLEVAERFNIELHLETGLPPRSVCGLLEMVNHPLLRVTYDTGNSTLFGYDPAEELHQLGSWVSSVHIKDHLQNGPSVSLGTGDTDFATCFRLLAEIGFAGPFVLQGARQAEGGEPQLAQQYREFVEVRWQRASVNASN
jgi:hexulose-6-phosphate isomerase